MATIYYVAKSGSDRNPGTKNCPFLTIQRAADVAVAGDTVIVHEGHAGIHPSPDRDGRRYAHHLA